MFIAKAFEMLQVVSGRRFIGGFPVGSSTDTYYAHGTNDHPSKNLADPVRAV